MRQHGMAEKARMNQEMVGMKKKAKKAVKEAEDFLASKEGKAHMKAAVKEVEKREKAAAKAEKRKPPSRKAYKGMAMAEYISEKEVTAKREATDAFRKRNAPTWDLYDSLPDMLSAGQIKSLGYASAADLVKACKEDFDAEKVEHAREKMIKIASRFPLPPDIEF